MKIRIFSSVILIFLSFINSAIFAEEETPILIKADRERIYKIDPLTGDENLIFKSDRIIHRLSLSPDNEFITFIDKDTLIIMNFEGQELHRVGGIDAIDAIKRYSWSPDGRIAYLTFVQKSPDYSYRYPTGLWIFNLETKEKEKIADMVFDVEWANFDTCIYFSDRKKVYKWDPRVEKIESTNFKGIKFSPDGKYYSTYNTEIEPYGYRLYQTSDNEDITSQLIKATGEESKYLTKYPYPEWLNGTNHLLLYIKKVYKLKDPERVISVITGVQSVTNFIYDPGKDKIIKKFSGDPTKLLCNNNQFIYIIKNDNLVFEIIPKEYLK